jgi:NitT/TauT family transport system ATP-binding protein
MCEIVLECRDVSHAFTDNQVLRRVNLKIARGQFVSLVGPSGVGKSTLLRAILGTHRPSKGRVLINGVPVSRPSRDCGIVYQRYSLFPFLTAIENVAFGLMLDEVGLAGRLFRPLSWGVRRRAHLEQAAELLLRLKLGDKLHHYPSELSGGMSQRVALAQALIMKPEILLLDEPFGALDEARREEQQEMMLDLYDQNLEAQRMGKRPLFTVIFVTHELYEALKVSDRVVALSRKQPSGSPSPGSDCGATIVYDAATPEHCRAQSNGTERLFEQRREIRQAVFEKSEPQDSDKFVRFWDEYRQGVATGVMRRSSALDRQAVR